MLNRKKCSRCLWSIIMELYLHKGLLVLWLLHLCQAQDAVPPSLNPEPEHAPPNLVDVIDAVKAAFEQAVKISKDDAVREVFEQVVEELVPQQDIAEQSPATKDATDVTLDAVVHKHAEDEGLLDALQEQAEPMHESSKQLLAQPNKEADKKKVVLGQVLENPVESVYKPNTSVQELKQPVQESPQEAEEPGSKVLKIEIVSVQEAEDLESVGQGPRTDLQEKLEDKGFVHQEDTEPDESTVQVELPLDSETEEKRQRKERREEAEGDAEKQGQEKELLQAQDNLEHDGVGKTEVGDKNDDRIGGKDGEGKVQKTKPEVNLLNLDEQIEQTVESQPGQNQEQSVLKEVTHEDVRLVQDNREDADQWGTVVLGGKMVDAESEKEQVNGEIGEAKEEDLVDKTEVRTVKATMVQKTSHEGVEVVLDTERAVIVEDVKGPTKPQEPVIESNSMDDVTQETNDLNGIITSRDPLLRLVEDNREAPTQGNKALPPFPTVEVEPGDTDELVEEPADKTQPTSPGQEVWKIGAIAAAFFLILQTIVTVVYILKCKRKPNSRMGAVKACEEGNSGENITANTETTIPAEEQIALDDLPEYSEAQQETIDMTAIPTDCPGANSSNDP